MSYQANVATLDENLQQLQVVFYHVNVSTFDLKGENSVCSLRLLEALTDYT